jgi:hypothetical protein
MPGGMSITGLGRGRRPLVVAEGHRGGASEHGAKRRPSDKVTTGMGPRTSRSGSG